MHLVPIEQLWCISLCMHSCAYITWHVPFIITAKVSWVWVPDVKVLTVNVMEESNKKLPNFTFGFEGDLAMLQASKSNELQQVKTTNQSQIKGVLVHKLALLSYETIMFMVVAVHQSSYGCIWEFAKHSRSLNHIQLMLWGTLMLLCA